ncbi:T9SS type A sorting domain-containing protein [Tunicatimonas pelagia]|uniref:T9SS type A sorting domain-containing protein n=1 Tax=Tunicatimonas pelagia TaxID=931531 RepID=UPI002665577B|nr:T9SS type A sorting domain-containing protein [Tunicatimonas pelagia]WKN41351.1 T9SS type A sorting domain-containing protein [Tunicatimonas pelagia]
MKYLVLSALLSVPFSVSAQCPDCYNPVLSCYNTPACVLQRMEGDLNGIPINCNDGIDNDGDGLTDCEDPSCNCTTNNVEICNDGIDNDGDGLIDCQDRGDCGASVACETDCSNGIDDDGDGFYDYYDGDCTADSGNTNTYIVATTDCEVQPTGNVFSIRQVDASANQTSAAMGMPMVADTDGDGTPEAITTNNQTGDIYVLNGADLSEIERQVGFGQGIWAYPVVADVDDDGLGEIFIVGNDGTIKAYQNDLTSYWEDSLPTFSSGRVAGIADFNLDGTPEMYQMNEIRDATTGNVLIPGSHGTPTYPSANNWQRDLNSAPVAIDLLDDNACADCSGLELVLGHIVYSVDLDNKHLTEVLNMDDATTKPADYKIGGYHPKDANFVNQNWSTTAVLDFNSDGHLDVLMGGTTGNKDGATSVFFWDLQNSEVKMFIVARPGNTIATNRGNFRDLNGGSCNNNGELCTWRRGLGALSVANIDTDSGLEVVFMSGSSLYALDENLDLEWENHSSFWESSSGGTGVSTFDFDSDGASEIIYRDEINLHIVDGANGTIVSNLLDGSFCSSQTMIEYPIIADVNGDGEAEIVVSCGRDRNTYGQPPATSSTRVNGHIAVYKAEGQWPSARKVWNQFSYFNTNINDDLSIPPVVQPHHLNFAQSCADPGAENKFPLNKFLSQSAYISSCGNPVFPAPRLDFVADSIEITSPTCPDREFGIRLIVVNNGDQPVTEAIPVSFYNQNPQQAYPDTDSNPHFAKVDVLPPSSLMPGEQLDTVLQITGTSGSYPLFISLNDRGPYNESGAEISNTVFYPLTELNGPIRECDQTPTIISNNIDPLPFQVQAQKIRDNRKCPGEIGVDNNGEVQVLDQSGNPLPASEYDFVWTDIASGAIVSKSAIATQLDSGNYRIEATYNNGGSTCLGTADTVRVERLEDWPDEEIVTVEIIQSVSNCTPGTADGQARVLIDGISPDEAVYQVRWEDVQGGDTMAVGHTANNLTPILYKVIVTNLLTGCSESRVIDMSLSAPRIDDVTVQNVTNCDIPYGSITVTMLGGNESSYHYILIQTSPLVDTLLSTTSTIDNLGVGNYMVRAYDPATECGRYTGGTSIQINDVTTRPLVTLDSVKEQTACQFPYNGQLSVTTPNPQNMEFVWYRGSGSSSEIVATGAITPDTLSTHITDVYTLITTNTITACSSSHQFRLPENTSVALSYAKPYYYLDEGNPIPTIEGTTGGTFTSSNPTSLLVNSTSGEIDLATSEPGVYTVTYTVEDCSESASQEITILEFPSISIAQANVCANEAISLSATGRHPTETYEWQIIRSDNMQFGLPASVRSRPSFIYNIDEPGAYEAWVVLSNEYATDTVLATSFSVKAIPEINLSESINLVADSLSLTAVDAERSDTTSLTFEWVQITNQDTVILASENTLWVYEPSLYEVKVKNDQGCLATSEVFVVDVRPEIQTITFDSIPDKRVDDPPFQLSAIASSGLPTQFTIIQGTEHISLNGDTVSLLSAGQVAIQAEQAGDERYKSADPVSRAFTIQKAEKLPRDTLYRIRLQLSIEADDSSVEVVLYRKHSQEVQMVEEKSATSPAVVFSDLEAGEYTLKMSTQLTDWVTTYTQQQLLLSEADWIMLTQDTLVLGQLIRTPNESEAGITLQGSFVEVASVNGGRIELTQGILAEGTPITNLAVYLVSELDGNLVAVATTDGKGEFSFPNIPAGTYRIVADYQGLPADENIFTVANQPLELTLIAGEQISLISTAEVKEDDNTITGVEDAVSSKVEHYPNPVKDMLQLRVPSDKVGSQLTIMNANGQIILSEPLNRKSVGISLSHLSSGYYQVKIIHRGKTQSFKILKE